MYVGKTLLEAVKLIKPTALVGVSAQGKAFSREVCEEMTKNDKNPLIYALSNPTSKAECTAEEAYTWTDGECCAFVIYRVLTCDLSCDARQVCLQQRQSVRRRDSARWSSLHPRTGQ
jgi:hypothetical protein